MSVFGQSIKLKKLSTTITNSVPILHRTVGRRKTRPRSDFRGRYVKRWRRRRKTSGRPAILNSIQLRRPSSSDNYGTGNVPETRPPPALTSGPPPLPSPPSTSHARTCPRWCPNSLTGIERHAKLRSIPGDILRTRVCPTTTPKTKFSRPPSRPHAPSTVTGCRRSNVYYVHAPPPPPPLAYTISGLLCDKLKRVVNSRM